jgi:NAD(P)-dependent dehydrogenase (short-subunit alcohol dehydrogenase family)
VALLARSRAPLDELARALEARGGRALAIACDLADPKAAAPAVALVAGALGRIDAVVNNAGTIEPIGPLAELDPAAWARTLAINLGGAFAMVHAALPHMPANAGTVVNVSSGAAHRPLEGWSAYCASKAGLAMLTRSLHLELGGRGLRAYGFQPGVVDTEMQVQIRASGINEVSRLRRSELLPPEEPAAVIAWLCAERPADLAGAEFRVSDPALRGRAGLPTTG